MKNQATNRRPKQAMQGTSRNLLIGAVIVAVGKYYFVTVLVLQCTNKMNEMWGNDWPTQRLLGCTGLH